MININRIALVAVMLSLLAILGCSTPPDKATLAAPDSPLDLESPVAASDFASPLLTPEKNFALNKPLIAEQTMVSGTGPAGTAIIIADVTLMAKELGSGIIQADGTFDIQVYPPLVEGRIIGIKVGMIKGETLSPNYEEQLMPYKGDEARVFPQLGFFWDTTTVLP